MVSTMNGPIPPHPYYDKSTTNSKVYLDIPAPRVRPEAQTTYKQAQGSMGMVLQIEGHRVPSGYNRPKSQPKDHMSANVRRMRQIQKQTRQNEHVKEEHQPKPVKALWKSSKYEEVASRVVEDLNKPPGAPRPRSASYLRAHSRSGFVPQSARPATPEITDEDLTVPKAQTARDVQLIRRDIDFIKLNGKSVKKAPMRRCPSADAINDLKKWGEEQDKKYKKGEIPKYLQHRKKQWEQDEQDRLSAIPDPDLPPGHRLMPSDERRLTLEKLKQTEKDLQCQMSALPVRTDTTRLKNHKAELDAKLHEVEEAIRIFSRGKVFVKLDD